MKENSIYSDARLYDLFFGQPASEQALQLYKDLIAEYAQSVLELACGTGKITYTGKGFRLLAWTYPEKSSLSELRPYQIILGLPPGISGLSEG